jgi:hypothetical protein
MSIPTKPASVTAVIRRLVILDQTANAKALEAKLAEAGFPNVKMSTITTIRADALATLREATALGLLRSASEPVAESAPAARPRRSRSRRQEIQVSAERN